MSVSHVLGVRFLKPILACGLLLAPLACGGSSGVSEGEVRISTVPTPPDYVSGGDVLVRVDLASGIELDRVAVSLNGQEATAVGPLAPTDRLGRPQHALMARVTGLSLGANQVVASLDGDEVTSLTVTNYPIEGPIFSGEHLEPYFCLDQLAPTARGPSRFAIGNGDFLDGSGRGEHCALETRVDYLYMPVGDDAEFRPLADPDRLPMDVSPTTTSEGKEVAFVVRLETGTINRAIYQIAALVDATNPQPDPWNPPSGWNGRLVYTFGGGCEAGFFQGTSTGGVLREDMLAAGYAVASSTLNVNAQGGCNDPLSAETAMMVKERFAEVHGPPLHTIGSGGSGGAMQQLLIAGAYPGILNGIMPSLTFPDATTYFIDTPDCRLLLRRYLNGRQISEETKRVMGGWSTWSTCENSLGPRTNRLGPDDCPAAIPQEARYDARTNPTGIRCSIYEAMRSVYGTKLYEEISPTPQVEFGRSPHDNTGVQYGLVALNEGLINKDLFLDLNEKAGGWDIDFQWRPERAEAERGAVRIAYQTGRVTTGLGGLRITPIIDERSYLDDSGNFHASYYSFVMRERLRRDNGHSNNYVLQRHGSGMSLAQENLALMDEWLTNLALDQSPGDLADKVVQAKPAQLVESCWDAEGNQIVEPQTFDTDRLYDNTRGRCNALYPPHT
ncbi:MAG: tannase/feruloyl esterase family alpha/beta hydrolase, partial [Gemmatimonadota bacterium]|nr:tannase/feruloyl esterase family alpha/beta hydrolase [Gemmatimonadota bacterium]